MIEPEKFFLKWNAFQANVNKSYRELRLSGHFSVVTLASEDVHNFPCHKVILCSSPHLASLLSSPHSSPLLLPNTKNHQLEAILDFIYHGEVEVDKYHLISFLALAERLQLKGLIKPGMAEEEGNALIEKKPVRSKINNKGNNKCGVL